MLKKLCENSVPFIRRREAMLRGISFDRGTEGLQTVQAGQIDSSEREMDYGETKLTLAENLMHTQASIFLSCSSRSSKRVKIVTLP